jgi:hypothetical protein
VLQELPLDGSPVRLGGAATEIFYVKAGHGTILAYMHLPLGQVMRWRYTRAVGPRC